MGFGQLFGDGSTGSNVGFRLWLHQHDLTRHYVAKFLACFFDDGIAVALQLPDASLKILMYLVVNLDLMLDFLILRALGAPFNRTVCSKDNFISNQRRQHTDAQRRENATHVIEPAADFAYTRHLRRYAETFVQLTARVEILKLYSRARRNL